MTPFPLPFPSIFETKFLETLEKSGNNTSAKFGQPSSRVFVISIIFSYLQYSAICARAVRKCLKPENVTEAMKAPESMLKLTKWQGGKPTDEVSK